MFLQTVLTNRRRFLERSALGAGSLLFAPLLLNSCTDHIIPNPPTNPTNPPHVPSADSGTDWNGVAKNVVTIGLQLIPDVGGFLGGLVGALWPDTQEDVWGDIKAQVEALVNQKIADYAYQSVTNSLGSLNDGSGLIGVMNLYLQELGNYNDSITKYQEDPSQNPKPDATTIRTQWQGTRDFFVYNLSNFQQKGSGYELLLLPLFVQFANLYLALLRDPLVPALDNNGYEILDPITGVQQLTGKTWGMIDADLSDTQTALTGAISSFTQWTDDTYNTGFLALAGNTQSDPSTCEPFNTLYAFNSQMVQTVFDFMDTWPYYDVSKYPNGAKNPDGTAINMMTREIYSHAYGSNLNSAPINKTIPFPVPTQFPTQITVWGYDRIDAVEVSYPTGGGPKGQSDTGRMGDQPDGKGSGGTNQPPHGGVFTTTLDNPVTQVRTGYYMAGFYWIPNGKNIGFVASLQFGYNNGQWTNACGGKTDYPNNPTPADSGVISAPGRALSSVYVSGVADIGSAECIVFGFRPWQAPAATLNAIRAHYVKSPKEKSVADYAKAYPKLTIPADLITDELKEIRKAYWAWIKAHAKK